MQIHFAIAVTLIISAKLQTNASKNNHFSAGNLRTETTTEIREETREAEGEGPREKDEFQTYAMVATSGETGSARSETNRNSPADFFSDPGNDCHQAYEKEETVGNNTTASQGSSKRRELQYSAMPTNDHYGSTAEPENIQEELQTPKSHTLNICCSPHAANPCIQRPEVKKLNDSADGEGSNDLPNGMFSWSREENRESGQPPKIVFESCDLLGQSVCLESLECTSKPTISKQLNCSNIESCILDVSYRPHACIDGFLFETEWATTGPVIICEKYPYVVWQTRSNTEWITKLILIVPVAVVSLVANGIVIYVIFRHKHLHRPANVFVGSLALAEALLVCFGSAVFTSCDLYQQYKLGLIMCKVQGFIELLLMLAKEFSLIAVCVDRLVLVSSRLRLKHKAHRWKKPTLKSAFFVTLFLWFSAAAVASPTIIYRFYAHRQWSDVDEIFCSEPKWMTRQFWPSVGLACFILPMACLIAAFMVVFCKLERYEPSDIDLYEQIVKRQLRKKLSLLFAILLIFFVCHAPGVIFVLVRVIIVDAYFESEDGQMSFAILWWLCNWLVYFNSAVNPFIYGFAHEGFRKVWPSTSFVSSWRTSDAISSSRYDTGTEPRVRKITRTFSDGTMLRKHSTPLAMEALRSLGNDRNGSRRTLILQFSDAISLCSCDGKCKNECMNTRKSESEEQEHTTVHGHKSLSLKQTKNHRSSPQITKLSLASIENDFFIEENGLDI